MCVHSVLFNIDKLGTKREDHPIEGIATGDSISPYLFLLCTKGLSAMLRKKEKEGHIKGVAVCKRAPRISHLLFADDSIIFYRASILECDRVIEVLEGYERDSGQKINKEKISLFFSKKQEGMYKIRLSKSLGLKLSYIMKNTWGYPH